ncbi:glycosyl transferase [Cellulomonas sp. S1-8]|uniref:glycosyl transferase n=1 Tax=Cellulomonas sp. S1-8 TaxID=2904790 RepID=UPI002244A263|nr:glycosyl transferase [Cellulomonas sp. S1-8]UZN04298.1 glycosyl transferase [Cellulomonas sp. S1-8]
MTDATRPLRVMQVLDPPDGTTRYADQVVRHLPADVEITWFTWRRAFTQRYDVLHVHWPERLVRDERRGGVRTWAKRAACLALVARCALLRVAVVRTEHNLAPHEPGDRVESWVLGALDRATAWTIVLNEATPVRPGRPRTLVRLADYREPFGAHVRPDRVAGRVLNFGIIRDYKGVDRLLDVVREIPDDGLTLRVVGRPATDRWREVVESAAAADPRVRPVLDFVPDAELVAHVGEAQLVVLPYRELHNSGAVLVPLSLDRPVLVPRTPTTVDLQHEVGAQWVHLYDGELTAADVVSSLAAAARIPPGERSGLTDRDWPTVGRRHVEVWRAAVAAVRHTPAPAPEDVPAVRG